MLLALLMISKILKVLLMIVTKCTAITSSKLMAHQKEPNGVRNTMMLKMHTTRTEQLTQETVLHLHLESIPAILGWKK